MSRPVLSLGRQLTRAVARLVVLLLGAGLLGACEMSSDLGAEVLAAVPVSGSVYLDTLTVRASTVLVDSVVTSTSAYLMVGQYTDSRLGTITARSYLRLALGSGAFEPDVTAQFDSVALDLPVDTYRYGDTTRVQHLQVHQLQQILRPATVYFAFSSLPYAATPLATRSFRPKGSLSTLHLRLPNALGEQLLQAGIRRQLSSDGQLENLLPGLALLPGATDDASLLRLLATSPSLALHLYYHLPSAPTETLIYDLTAVAGERHFYQVQADRRATLLRNLTASRQALPSAQTAQETYIQGALGLQTKLEIPYLLNLNELGGTWVLNGATLTVETVTGTENRYLPPPAYLTAQTTDRGNHSGTFLANLNGGQLTAPYQHSTSGRTNLEQGSYTFSVQSYVEAVLKRQTTHNGLLLAPASLDTPERVVLGAPVSASNPLRLGVYLTKIAN